MKFEELLDYMNQVHQDTYFDDKGFIHLVNPPTDEEMARYHQKQQQEYEQNKCPRCGGQLYYGSCDCTWEPGAYGVGGEWTS
jgi:hypothetical protein